MDSATTETLAIDRKIQEWKERLSGVKLSSRLLNFRKDRQSIVEFSVPALAIFRNVTKEETQGLAEDGKGLFVTSVNTPHDEKDLLKRLQQLRRDARAIQRQKDLNPLFIALGTLTWTLKNKPDDLIISPIFLFPIELQRIKSKNEYKAIPTTETPFVNPVLTRKLEAEHGIGLGIGQDDQTWDYAELIKAIQSNVDVSQKIQDSEWQFSEQAAFLSLFERPKDSMLRDLEQHPHLFAQHPILQGLAGDWQAYQSQVPKIYRAEELDHEVPPESMFQVLDADSSQQVVIEAAKAGLSYVVQGPPGTGKSQTIVNIIAELVAQGKKVLVVAEKSVALQVVADRLEKSELGDLCLNLSDDGGVNKETLATVLRQTKDKLSKKAKGSWDSHFFYKLRNLRNDLNRYSENLHRNQPPLGKSAFSLYEELVSLEKQSIPSLDFRIPGIRDLSTKELFTAKKIISELGKFSQLFLNDIQNVWGKSTIQPPDISATKEQIKLFLKAVEHVIESGKWLERLVKKPPQNLMDVKSAIYALQYAVQPPKLPEDWYKDTDGFLTRQAAEINRYVEEKEFCRSQIIVEYTDGLLDQALQHFEAFKVYRNKKFRILRLGYCRTFLIIYSFKRKKSLWRLLVLYFFGYKRILNDLRKLEIYQDYCSKLRDRNASPRREFERFFKDDVPDLEGIQHALQWIQGLENRDIHKAPLGEVLKVYNEQLHNKLDELIQAQKALQIGCDQLRGFFPSNTWLRLLETKSLTEIALFLKEAEAELSRFREWLDYRNCLQILESGNLKNFLDVLRNSDIPPEVWSKVFEKGFYTCWLHEILDSNSDLRTFDRTTHEENIKTFAQLDCQQYEVVARSRLREKHRESWRNWISQPSSKRQDAILVKEGGNRKKKEIRQVIKEISELMLTLKPCWLMSPLAVSVHIPPDSVQFDTVIFDEASQLLTEDAVCSIMRSRQVIIVGDDKQMPPTSFFSSSSLDEDSDDEETFESLLNECMVINSFAHAESDQFTLKGHYRSQDESLISFSNKQFYDSKLISFPSPLKDRNRGVHFYCVENGVYDRGRTSTNPHEAQEVAKLALEHVQNAPNQSLGIIAFSKAQANAIQERLDRLSEESAELAIFQDDVDKFFLRNLENVQGDERDVIILSFGYGKDREGKFDHTFTSLTRSGGERRFNVAITRAKYKLLLVASVRSDAFKPDGKKSEHVVRMIQEYFKFAEKNDDISWEHTEEPAVSPLVDDIYDTLKEQYQVIKSVGNSEYQVDLAVVSDKNPQRILLGIECDGETYNAYPTARDRDRLRKQVLTNLNWQVYRIWSREWFRNKEGEAEKLFDYIEKLRGEEQQ
jgi:very-short-patch-repair endonuclease/DNA polymerase III delta prime subunit